MKRIDGYTKEQWDEMHAKGERAATWEQALKLEQKKKRSEDKRKMTIAKKAAKATLKELTEAELKIQQLERWLDDTSVPLSDDEMKAMSVYFDSENFSVTK